MLVIIFACQGEQSIVKIENLTSLKYFQDKYDTLEYIFNNILRGRKEECFFFIEGRGQQPNVSRQPIFQGKISRGSQLLYSERNL